MSKFESEHKTQLSSKDKMSKRGKFFPPSTASGPPPPSGGGKLTKAEVIVKTGITSAFLMSYSKYTN